MVSILSYKKLKSEINKQIFYQLMLQHLLQYFIHALLIKFIVIVQFHYYELNMLYY